MKSKKSYGDGDMSKGNYVSDGVMSVAALGKERMEAYANGGGLKGYQNGGDVLFPQAMKKGGGTKKGMMRKTARRAYMKK